MDIRKLQRAIVDGLEDVKAQDIAVFNTEHLSPLFERVIIASGTSNRQTKALAASVRDEGASFVVTCRFPKGAPDTASFSVRGETLVIKARFGGADEEREVELPGPVHPMGARSELRNGELVVTLPKTS